MLKLFQAFGIELEYMVVDRDTLRPKPIAESILLDENGETVQEISIGAIDVSNELATHVLEFKTSVPTKDFETLEKNFSAAIREMNQRLAAHNAMLAPGGVHPFMDPATEGHTWSKGDRTIYDAYNRIFNCSSHGWFNLQSCHLNLPFANEEEFARLHAAIIIVLPYLPALAASSPYLEGAYTGHLDKRIDVYKGNQRIVPEIAGSIIPESVFTFQDYQEQILQKTYKAIKPHDPDGILQYEWLNSRGAIARFDRNAIEIRVLDTQETPHQDLAICTLIIALLESLCALEWPTLRELALSHSTKDRKAQFLAVAQEGFEADLDLKELVTLFKLSPKISTVGELWSEILDIHKDKPEVSPYKDALSFIVHEGSLAERLIVANGKNPTNDSLKSTLQSLATCLDSSKRFETVFSSSIH